MPRLPVYRLAEVDAWERAGGPGARGAAAQAIRDAVSNRHRRIDLGNLGLTDLPPLPDWAETLVVNGNPLDRLPPLPSRLVRLYCRHAPSLRELPPLPGGLQDLDCAETALAALPALPEGLATLWLADSPLRELPALPASLRRLQLAGLPLRTLPALPDGLRYLQAHDCDLETVPERWPSQLRVLDLSDNRLTALPDLPPALERYDLTGNPIAGFLPDTPAEARPLGDAAAAWYPSSSRAERCAAWGAFADESGAQAFSSFLDALNGSPWGRSHAFARDMRAWLDRLASPGNDALRRTTFAISLDATQTCHDRALYALYGMRMQAVLADVEAGRYDRRAGTLVALARSFQAFEAMTRVAQRIVDARVDATGAVAGREEEIEVYLALVQAFERVLPPMLRDAPMLYEASAELSAGDRAVAARELEALAPAFPRFLCNWEPLANALKRWHPARYEGSDALLRDKIDNGDFEAYQRAHGFAGTAALEALRHEVFLPLVDDYLKVHGVDAAFLAPVEVTRF